MDKNNTEISTILENTKKLIKAKRYDEARALLEKLDAEYGSPITKKWLQKLDAIISKDVVATEAPAPAIENPNSGVVILPEKPPREEPNFLTRYRLPIIVIVAGIFAFAILGRSPDPETDSFSMSDIISPTPTQTATATATPRPRATQDITADEIGKLKYVIESTTGDLPVNPQIEIVNTRGNNGKKTVVVTYTTNSSNVDDYQSEWNTIIFGVGGAVSYYNMDIDQLYVVMKDSSGNTIGTFLTRIQDLLDLFYGRIGVEDYHLRIEYNMPERGR